MDVSPYLMRRLRSLEEYLEARGTNATLWRQEIDRSCKHVAASPAAPTGAKGERTHLVLVCSNERALTADGGGR
jgi:hypothetical protein